jgi:C4-dicarboxylate-specific signal transduction histidine kinase
MNAPRDPTAAAGLQFFGQVAASMSHEIKNCLAIMNENAGLLHDLALLAEKGRPLTPERVKSLAEKMTGQIRRADLIVRNLNRFAHSVDEPDKRVDLTELVRFTAELAGRRAAMQGIELQTDPGQDTVTAVSVPFFLSNLIWCCLDLVLPNQGHGAKVGIRAETGAEGSRIRISGLKGLEHTDPSAFPGARERMLLALLEMELTVDPAGAEVVLSMPAAARTAGRETTNEKGETR